MPRREAVLVALNSLFQIAPTARLGTTWSSCPGWLGPEQSTIDFAVGAAARAVAMFLGMPLSAG